MTLESQGPQVPHGTASSNDVPMTRPEELLALHEKFIRKPAFVQLDGGRILAARGAFAYSDDGGLTWCEPFQASAADGEPLGVSNLIKLDGGLIGGVAGRTRPGSSSASDMECVFWTSEDGGRSWADPRLMNEGHQRAYAFQDTIIRTRSGRIIQPVYTGMGQGKWHHDDAPFAGGYLNGRFVSTDAHFFDPHFFGCYVLYSDDEGRTWQPNSDGDLFIHLKPDGPCYRTTEPSVVEVEPNKLMMILRTTLGRLFQSWSTDNGETWSRPFPTQLAGTEAPGKIRKLPATGHLLVVWTQVGSEEVHRGLIRARLSSAISRNGGGMWEFFQNVESILEGTHVEPGPIEITRPKACYPVHPQKPALAFDTGDAQPLPENYGRFSYPSVLALEDRVLIAHGYSWHEGNGDQLITTRLKVLPLSWFYDGQDPKTQSAILDKIEIQCPVA